MNMANNPARSSSMRRWVLWLCVALTAVLAIVAFVQLLRLLDEDWREQLPMLPRLAWYFLGIGFDALYRVPSVAWPTLLLVIAYLTLPLLLAQSKRERLFALVHVPVAVLMMLGNVIGFVTPILAGLAGQGAGH
jgi:hypothetical protein